MLKAIRGNSELSKYAEILPDDIEINPNVKNVVSVLENGKPVNVEIHDKNLLEALQGLYKTNDVKGAKAFKIFNDVFKSLITQKNPVFAIRNIARDLPTGYVFGSEKNPFKYLRDVVVAGKDLFKNTEIAQQYKALGGENANFLNTKKMYKAADRLMDRKLLTGDNGEIIGSKKINPVKKGLSKLGDAVETFNNVTESAPRLAEFKRTLGKTGDLQKALYEAGEITTNFSRGGDITKKYDVFVPYLNAGVQGLDKLARQIRNKPIATAAKGIIGIGALTIVLDQVNKDNPNYKQLDNRTKDNYFLFPHGDTFIKIPKSRELGVAFGSLFERIIRSNRGDKQAFKGFLSTVKTNISPANPLENNILSPLMVNIPKNKDFADRSIVPENMKDRSPQYQYDEYTSEVAKKLGQITKLSPKQIDYLIKSYTGVIGQLGIPATTKANYESGTPLEKILKPVTTQFIADPLYSNNIITNFYDNYDKLKQKAADKNFIEKIPGKEVTEEEKLRNAFAKASKEISDLNKQAKEAEKKNDITKVKELRKQMIKIAGDANKLVR
jgi:hypothetical protein